MKVISWKLIIPVLILTLIIGLSGLVTGCGKTLVASFIADKYVTSIGNAVQFFDESTSEVSSWLWDFGDGDNSREQNPTHVYTLKGKYSVQLTVLTKEGNSTARTSISVLQTPTADFTARDVASVAESIQFTDKSNGDINSYSWDFGDGQTSSEQNPFHSYNGTGSFTVSLKVSNQVSNNTKTEQVKIIAPVIADFSASKNAVQTGSVIEFVDKSGGDINSYSWDFGDGQTSSEQNPSHSYNGTGSFTVSLRVSNQVSNNTKTMQVKIIAPVKADFSATTIQTGSTIQFADKSTGDVALYSWDFGDGSTGSEKNPKHTYTTRGSYNVTLTVSNDINSDTLTGKVQVSIPSLSITPIMCSNIVSNEDYIVKPDATYKKYNPVYVYLEVKGFQQNHTDNGYDICVQLQSLKVIRPDGSLLLNLSDVLENKKTTLKASIYIYFWYYFGTTSANDLLGQYTVECVVLDKLSGDSKTVTTTFILK
jgi:PKD repeat protein